MASVALKRSVKSALDRNDLESIHALSGQNRGVLSTLIRLAYDKTTLEGWRAIKAVGLVARDYVSADYQFLRDTVRKLLWSLSDESGGIGWSAPELIGEIVSADPVKFADIIPILAEFYDIEEDTFRPGILYALRRIAEVRPAAVLRSIGIVERALQEKDPLLNIYAIQTMVLLRDVLEVDKKNQINYMISCLKKCKTVAWIYKNDDFVDIEVGGMAESYFL